MVILIFGMVKLINKPHEQQQDKRIKKLESDLKQQKSRINKLEKRITSLASRKTLKKKK